MARDKDKEREREHLFTSEQDVRRARRHHRDRRRESERAERPTTAAGAEVLGLDELRAVRAAYYLRPEEERRARTPKRMTQEVERERQRELERVEAMVKSRRETERRQGGETKRRKEKKLEERDEDVASAEFVYGRPEARRSTRSVRENSPDGETRWVVRTTDGERVSGTRSIRRSVDTFQDEGGSSRRAAEGEPRSRSRAERRGVSPEQTGHRTVSRTISVRRVNTPKLHRSVSAREPPRAYTRPSIRRTNTTTRTTKPTTTPTSIRASRAPPVTARAVTSTTPSATPNRRSTGLLATLFKPSPPRTPPSIQQKAQLKVECIICMTDDLPAHKTAGLACGHRMCHSCIKRQFALSVHDPQHMPPRCCTDEHIPLKHVERLFDDKFKKLWNKKYQEYNTKNRIYCPTKECGEWIKPSKVRMDLTVGRKYAQCGRCRTKVCVLCNGKFHTRRECPKDEETKRLVHMAKQKGWQRCYNCKTMVELKEGCNHMTCRCAAQFCMLCAARWKTCNCPWFNYENIEDTDRLNHMRVPYDPNHTNNIIEVAEIPTRPPPRNHNDPAGSRRAQEQLDEALAAHLQAQMLLSPTPAPSEPNANVHVYSLGNAGGHYLNESYTMRPPLVAVTAGAPPPLARVFRRQSVRERVIEVQEVPEPGPERAPANAAVMAGLARDGSRRGAARVGGWLQHVEFGSDPAEVDGRRARGVGEEW